VCGRLLRRGSAASIASSSTPGLAKAPPLGVGRCGPTRPPSENNLVAALVQIETAVREVQRSAGRWASGDHLIRCLAKHKGGAGVRGAYAARQGRGCRPTGGIGWRRPSTPRGPIQRTVNRAWLHRIRDDARRTHFLMVGQQTGHQGDASGNAIERKRARGRGATWPWAQLLQVAEAACHRNSPREVRP